MESGIVNTVDAVVGVFHQPLQITSTFLTTKMQIPECRGWCFSPTTSE